MGTPVEIEFAVNLSVPEGEEKNLQCFKCAQWFLAVKVKSLMIGDVKEEDTICQSNQVLGNGAVNGIYDVIIVDYEKFDRGKSKDVAMEVSKLNSKLLAERKPYLLLVLADGVQWIPGLGFLLRGIRFPVRQ